jgi:hypothetical protein
MSRGAQTFKQGDVTKALKGAANAGLQVQRFEIDPSGRILIFTGQSDDRHQGAQSPTEWDNV